MAKAAGMSLRDARRRMLRRVLGRRYDFYQVRWRSARRRFESRIARGGRAQRRYVRRHGLAVRHGPLAGLRYPTGHIGLYVALQAQLLGAFERELHEVLAEQIETPPDLFVNIGCAEGYYAVGMALKVAQLRVLAYDIDPLQQKLVREMAELNGVAERVAVRGECTRAELATLPEGRLLVLSDCEGAELELIDPSKAPPLGGATLIVELHENERPGVREALLRRLRETHEVREIETEARYLGEYPELTELEETDRALAVSEFRAKPMSWLVCRPR
jgi:hypothetical protein